jgi:predicted metal-dependent hydrolase
MTDLVVRRLMIDLEAPFARHWCGGDAFRSAFFNALSMSFPVGEQFFIDAVREAAHTLPEPAQAEWKAELQGFVGQEATHRHLHALFNRHLEQQGLVNRWAPRVLKRMKRLQGLDVRHPLAITVANEHFTAILADWLLAHPEAVASSDERLSTLWLWHSAEESEHKSTAFDLYAALSGSHAWRVRWFRRVTVFFLGDLLRQTLRNLWHDGSLWQWRTWRSAASFLFGQHGLVRALYKPWRAFLRTDFHPAELESSASQRWLHDHQDRFRAVARAA